MVPTTVIPSEPRSETSNPTALPISQITRRIRTDTSNAAPNPNVRILVDSAVAVPMRVSLRSESDRHDASLAFDHVCPQLIEASTNAREASMQSISSLLDGALHAHKPAPDLVWRQWLHRQSPADRPPMSSMMCSTQLSTDSVPVSSNKS